MAHCSHRNEILKGLRVPIVALPVNGLRSVHRTSFGIPLIGNSMQTVCAVRFDLAGENKAP